MNRTKFAILLLGAALALVLAGACGGGAGSSTSAATRNGAAAVAPAPAAQPTPTGSAASGGAVPDLTVPEGPRVQRNGRISLQVADGRFDSTLNDVIAIVDQAGGYIAGSDVQAADQGSSLRSGQATFQVPADKFDGVLTQVRRKGTPLSISIS